MIKDAAVRAAQEKEINNTIVTGPGGRTNHARTQAAREALRMKFGHK